MGGYNWIYRELVESEDDLIGAIAYSLYKRHKIEYIQQCEQETGDMPTSEQMAEFHRISSSQTSLDHYRHQADMLLSNLLNFATENIVSEMQRQQKEVIYQELQTLLAPIQTEIAKKEKLAIYGFRSNHQRLWHCYCIYFGWIVTQGLSAYFIGNTHTLISILIKPTHLNEWIFY